MVSGSGSRLERKQVRYDGVHCSLLLERLGPYVVLLKISGSDVGEFGESPMQVLSDWLAHTNHIRFFIDARAVRGASVDVSGEWAKWLAKTKEKFDSITMLTGTPFIHITAEFVRRFSELEGIMRICTDPEAFETVLQDALKFH
jgi:hypothetical protein